jgi:hypothetical protein
VWVGVRVGVGGINSLAKETRSSRVRGPLCRVGRQGAGGEEWMGGGKAASGVCAAHAFFFSTAALVGPDSSRAQR